MRNTQQLASFADSSDRGRTEELVENVERVEKKGVWNEGCLPPQ